VQGAHASRAAEYLLRSGFTTIRDIAGNTIGLKRAINSGVLPGPRVYTAGPALGPTGGHQDWGSRLAAPGESNYQLKVQNTMVLDGVDQWLKGARWNLRNGADFLKVMSGGGVASEFDPMQLCGHSRIHRRGLQQVDGRRRQVLRARLPDQREDREADEEGGRVVVLAALWQLQHLRHG
jgi:hypothetical protein